MQKIVVLYFSLVFIRAATNTTDAEPTTRLQSLNYGRCDSSGNDTSEVICTPERNGNVFPNNISLSITSLKLNSKEVPWQLTKLDSFTRFSKLETLNIFSEIEFSTDLTDSIKNLKRQLFNIKSVSTLRIRNSKKWTFVGGDDKWTPPPNVSYIVFQRCPPERFDWRDVTSLQIVSIEDTNLTSLSEVVYPSARSLTYLHLKKIYNNNDEIVFKIHDIAFLCRLTKYSFDGDVLQRSEHYCECRRYLDWKKFLADQRVNLLYQTRSIIQCKAGKKTNCSDYTLDEAKQNYDKCLNWPPITTTKPDLANPPATITTKPSTADKSLWDKVRSLPLYVYIISGVIFLILVVTSIVALVKKMRSSDEDEEEEEEEFYEEEFD